MAQAHTSIRRGDAADASLLARLGARTFFDTFSDSTKPEDMAAYLSASFGEDVQAAELADAGSTFFVAETGGAPSGYAKLHAGEALACVGGREPVELARLYVLREWLGRGVGEALMRSCVEEARRAGHSTMWLGVWEHNARAQAFYRRWGFRVVGEHVFRVGSDPQIDLIMERAL
ncbi:MAG: GNAT family N-acetyltransferase [Acidobacteria bacterium]|nr:GNAT family N-acetyltransferase [Acidobacteriota bacterium]